MSKRSRDASQDEAPQLGDLLRMPVGPCDLDAIDPRSTPGFTGTGKQDALAEQADHADRLAELQERLFAEGRTGGSRAVLLVLQGMDTAGKGGTVRHVLGQVDPQGCRITAFGPPTAEERRHDFLWRIKKALPEPGYIGVFDRSHYEDVATVRVRRLAGRSTWSRRYATINRFEASVVASGTRVVKCFLHISADESQERLLARLEDPTKHWKFRPGDVDERAYWDDYQQAYADAITRCNTELAPWYVVPADRKWYRNWAITRLLLEELEAMALVWPTAEFDVAAERARLLSS